MIEKILKTDVHNIESQNTASDSEVVYTVFGKHDRLDVTGNPVLIDIFDQDKNKYTYASDRLDACCKIKSSEHGPVYLAKVNVLTGFLYDPYGLFDDEAKAKKAIHKGKHVFEYKRITEKVFNFYLKFLRTRNKAHLINAQRELY